SKAFCDTTIFTCGSFKNFSGTGTTTSFSDKVFSYFSRNSQGYPGMTDSFTTIRGLSKCSKCHSCPDCRFPTLVKSGPVLSLPRREGDCRQKSIRCLLY